MPPQILIAHAREEEALAAKLAAPLEAAGYTVVSEATVMVGESIMGRFANVLETGGPVVFCGTARAAGSTRAKQFVRAAQNKGGVRVFVVQMEDDDADLNMLALDGKIARYWEDPSLHELISALQVYFPLDPAAGPQELPGELIERRYRALALEACDIIDLANMPQDREITMRKLELRRLYVPLRVQLESGEGTDEEHIFAALEQQRLAWRGGPGGKEPSIAPQRRERVPLGSRLAAARRLVVLGDPGAGKSTLLRWIATAYLLRLKGDPDWRELPDVATLPDADWLPVLVRCRDLDQHCLNGALDDVLSHTLRKAELGDSEAKALRELLRAKLRDGSALLLLDGLDEISDPAQRARFCQQIERIHSAYPNAPIIATSRIVGYREMGTRIGRGFEHMVVSDLEPEEKDDFVQRWTALTELPERRATACAELIRAIHSSNRIERLTGNPMLLTTLALVKRKVGKLPNRRADLYWEAVQVLLNWRSDVDAPIDQHAAIPQLEYLAYAMCDRGVQQLHEDDVIELLTKMRAAYPQIHAVQSHTPSEFLRLLERRTGILVEIGHTRHLGKSLPLYEFRHLTIQEYLAARALVDERFPGQERGRSLAEVVAPLAGRMDEDKSEQVVSENWREALRLCVACCRDSDVDSVLCAIRTPLPNEDPASARPRAVMAAACLADEPNVSEAAAQEVLHALLGQVQHKDADTNTTVKLAMQELAASRWASALQALLLDEFCHQPAAMREVYGTLYGQLTRIQIRNDGTSGEQLVVEWAAALDSADERVAIAAALNLRQWAYRLASEFPVELNRSLFSLLAASPPAAHAAAATLSSLNQVGARWKPTRAELDWIIAFIGDPASDPQAVRYLLAIVGRVGDQRALDALLARLDDPHLWVRPAAAEALGELGDGRALDALLARLDDPAPDVREAAAWALGELGDGRALDALLARLDDPAPDVRQAAARALGALGDGRALEGLLACLDDPAPDVREAAARALGRLGDGRALEGLLACLDAPEQRVREAAAWALGELGDGRALEGLLACLDDPEQRVRRAAAEALGEIGDGRALEGLLACLDGPAREVRWAAARALGEIGDGRALEGLLACLDDPAREVRRAAAAALGEIGDGRALEGLLACLDDPHPWVREAAAEALGELGDGRALEGLLARLDGPEPWVRHAAAAALGELGDGRALEGLLARLDGPEPWVRQAAARALGRLGDGRALEGLLARLDDPDQDVREAAAAALGEIGDGRALEGLLACLDDPAPDVRQAAAAALGEIGDGRALEGLLACLDDPAPDVRQAAARALGALGDGRALEGLLACLDDPDQDLREAAARALGRLGDGRALERLLARLDDPDQWVRQAAAGALGRLGDGRALEGLLACLDDPHPWVRQAADEALGRLGDGRALEGLLARLDDPDQDLREAAARALGRLGDGRALEGLLACLDDPHPWVRQAAAEALGRLGDGRALDALLACRTDPYKNVRSAVDGALVRLGHAPTITRLMAELHADLRWQRCAALGALAQSCSAALDRKLLARDLNDWERYLDPQQLITERRVAQAARSLSLPADEIRRRYEALGERFGLRLEWKIED